MKQAHGFNLLELLLVITISSLIILFISTTYTHFLAGYIFNTNKMAANGSLQRAIGLITHDLENAGVFGSFSFHNSPARAYTTIGNCTDDWCYYQLMGVGATSYLAGTSLNGFISRSASEILRVQFGGDQMAYYVNKVNNCVNGNISALNFEVVKKQRITAKTYMLAAANHAYLINLPVSSGNWHLDLAASCQLAAGAIDNQVMLDPEQATLTLVPFITHYYYVATINGSKGLYGASYNGLEFEAPGMISSVVDDLWLNYLVDVGVTPEFNHTQLKQRYIICTTADMDGGRCSGLWSRVIAVSLFLRLKAINGSESRVISHTVSWLW